MGQKMEHSDRVETIRHIFRGSTTMEVSTVVSTERFLIVICVQLLALYTILVAVLSVSSV